MQGLPTVVQSLKNIAEYSNLFSARRIHTEGKPYKCKKCMHTFRNIQQEDQKNFTQNKQYKCKDCPKLCSPSRILQNIQICVLLEESILKENHTNARNACTHLGIFNKKIKRISHKTNNINARIVQSCPNGGHGDNLGDPHYSKKGKPLGFPKGKVLGTLLGTLTS